MNCTTTSGRPRGRLMGMAVSWLALAATFCVGVAVGVQYGSPVSNLQAAQQVQPREPTGQATAFAAQSVSHQSSNAAYVVTTHRQSYFKLDAHGTLDLRNGLPYRSESRYRFERTVDPNKTAIVVMDPWVDMASEHLNEYYGAIAESRIVPLVTQALDKGHPVMVLTNDPKLVKYNTGIHPELAALAAGGAIEVLFHQAADDDEFAKRLRSKGIDSLVYTGFASNMCVIGRRMGMIPMVHQGFRLFFVPEASAAAEYPETWQDQTIHQATTKIISQWIAEVIDYDELMRAIAS